MASQVDQLAKRPQKHQQRKSEEPQQTQSEQKQVQESTSAEQKQDVGLYQVEKQALLLLELDICMEGGEIPPPRSSSWKRGRDEEGEQDSAS